MTENEFKSKLTELAEKARALPASEQAQLASLFAETRRRHETIQHNAVEALSALDDWRITVKYFIFDREASAREQQN